MSNVDTIRDIQDLIDRAKSVGMLGWRKAQIALAALSTIDPEIVKLRELLAWAMTCVDSDHDAGLTFPAERKMAEIAHAAILGKEAEK